MRFSKDLLAQLEADEEDGDIDPLATKPGKFAPLCH